MTLRRPASARAALLAALTLSLTAAQPGRLGAQWTDKVTTTPVFVQDGFGPAGNNIPFGGQEFCCPAAAAMSLGYLGVNGFNQIAPSNPTPADGLNLIRVLSGLMSTDVLSGTAYNNMPGALGTYLNAKGISSANFSVNTVFSPTLSQLAGLNQNQTVVQLCCGYYDVTTGLRNGGHCVTLLSQGVDAQGQPSPGTLVINNPLPGAFTPLADLPGNSRQYLNTTPTGGGLASAGAVQFDAAQYPAFWGNTRSVIERAIALTVNANQLSSNNPTPAPWALSSTQTINLQGGALTVLAPLQGAGGINKGDGGLLELTAADATTGANTVANGTLRSDVASGRPFGSGSLALQAGALQLVPAAGAAAVSLTAADGAGSTLTYSAGASLVLNRNGNTSLTFTVGGNTDGTTPNLARSGNGTLVIAPAGGTAGLGVTEQFVVAGTGGNLPALANGIVAPHVVARDSDAGGSGDFLTYGPGGFARAAYTQASSTPIGSAGATAVYEANVAQTLAAGTTAQVYALKVGPVAVGGAGGTTTLAVGSLAAGTQAGLILNGGTVSTTNLNFGAAEGVVYTSGAGGTVSAVVQGSGGLTTFGPGALTLTAANAYTGPTNVLSGTLVAANASGSATGSGAVTVAANATLQVNGPSGRAGTGGVTVRNGGTLLLSGGTVGGSLNLTAGSYLLGQGTVTGPAFVSGYVGGSGSNPSAVPFTGVTSVTFTSSATFGSPVVYAWRLNALDANPADAGVNWSLLRFTGPSSGINMGTPSSRFSFTPDLGPGVPDPSSGDPFWNQPHHWLAAQAPNGFNNIWYVYSFATYSQGFFALSVDSPVFQNLFVDFTPTPEPATWGLYAAAAGLAAWRARRRAGSGRSPDPTSHTGDSARVGS
jgi:autotransporter-associated beta strand protein